MKSIPGLVANIIKCKCPRCRQGRLFKYGMTWNFNKMLEMNKTCDHCGLDFIPEPGYYYGAMFVSYGFAVAEIALILFLVQVIFGSLSTYTIVMIIAAVILVLSPFNFRLGRSGWISIFYRYDPHFKK